MARIHLDILRASFFIFLFLLLGLTRAAAQISPGPLSRGHEALEGVNNCTSCHERGSEIAPSKCLSCHMEINSAIFSKHGMHALNSGHSCNECHKEHLGRDVQITRFSPKTFNHKETGFLLDGKHDRLDCAQCHDQARFKIEKGSLPKNASRTTYLGLRFECVNCHEDRHERTAGLACQTCHTTAAWAPTKKFDHGKTHFPLTGKHGTVTCAKCHEPLAIVPHPAKILFSVNSFDDCSSCHKSPHKPSFTRNRRCSDCHTTEGWKSTTAFNHSVTRFPLVGKHTTVSCEKCHAGLKNQKEGAPVDFATKPFNDCRFCHQSPHNETLNRNACFSCHTPSDWRAVENTKFDHSQTGFPLRGKHAQLDCEKCHDSGGAKSFAVRYNDSRRCAACHEDYHKGAFKDRYHDCADCHEERWFTPSLFTMEQHSKLPFRLTGSHAAILCRECHVKKNGTTLFVFQSLQCITCHNDVHKGVFRKVMGRVGCATCHAAQGWHQVNFDHQKTGFALVGRHALLACSECHTLPNGTSRYANTPDKCSSCHDEPHHKQFEQAGVTSCERCHTAQSWHLLAFNHETQSTFHLNGAHARVPCGACHKAEGTGTRRFTRFKPLPQTCESCHQGSR